MSQLLVELQCEELPASFVRPALAAFSKGVLGLLEGIEHGAHRTYATPRRLAVVVDAVTEARPLIQKTVTGPPVSSAYKEGALTRAALGFARGKGIDPSDLIQVEGPKGPVIAARVEEGGETTIALLAEGLDGVIRGIPFRKSMEWGVGGVRFARPLHRVNVVYAGASVPGRAAGLSFGNETVGHRLAERTAFQFSDEASWLVGLRERSVEPDLAVREAKIRGLLAQASADLHCEVVPDAPLLEEVLHLVEAPTLVLGSFDEALLDLPPRLLIKAMKAHQRYFPTFSEGKLTPHFVVISNNPWGDAKAISTGNANVLHARFHDAQFFFAEDQKKRLEQHGEQLDKMRWIRGLGSMAEKAERVAALAASLAPLFGADPDTVRRAGVLSKCDLATQMVGEFPDLQGHIGRLYATAQGEPDAVAIAIEEHYKPAFTGDSAPAGAEGAALGVAERLDSLTGCFGIGMVPKGSGDPQGLRRAVLGILTTLRERSVRVELSELFGAAATNFDRLEAGKPGFEAWTDARVDQTLDALVSTLCDFTSGRFRAHATKSGVSGDLVDAVLAVGSSDLHDRQARLDALCGLAGSPDFLPIMHTFKRVLNITRDHDFGAPESSSLTEPAERTLFAAAAEVAEDVAAAVEALDYTQAFKRVLSLSGPVAGFFDSVLVDAPDPAVKAVRMGLLLRVARIFRRLADFSRISTR